MKSKPEVGMKVFVSIIYEGENGIPNATEPIEGEIVGFESIHNGGYLASDRIPIIRLRDGRKVRGHECYWSPKPCGVVRCKNCLFVEWCSEKLQW